MNAVPITGPRITRLFLADGPRCICPGCRKPAERIYGTRAPEGPLDLTPLFGRCRAHDVRERLLAVRVRMAAVDTFKRKEARRGRAKRKRARERKRR